MGLVTSLNQREAMLLQDLINHAELTRQEKGFNVKPRFTCVSVKTHQNEQSHVSTRRKLSLRFENYLRFLAVLQAEDTVSLHMTNNHKVKV